MLKCVLELHLQFAKVVIDSLNHFVSDLVEIDQHFVQLFLSVGDLLRFELFQVVLEALLSYLNFLTTIFLYTGNDVHLWDLAVLLVVLDMVVDAVRTQRLVAGFETAKIGDLLFMMGGTIEYV